MKPVKYLSLAVIILLACSLSGAERRSPADGHRPVSSVVTTNALKSALPVFAKITTAESQDEGPLLEGELPGSVGVAAGRFRSSLRRKGWVLKAGLELGRGEKNRRRVLSVWSKSGLELYLVLAEIRIAKTKFSIGTKRLAQ